MLEPLDLALFRTLSPNGEHFNVTLQFSIKNRGNTTINVIEIDIPDANYTFYFTNLKLAPGDVYTSTLLVLLNAPYSEYGGIWDAGTVHDVIFHYSVEGYPYILTVTEKGTVQ